MMKGVLLLRARSCTINITFKRIIEIAFNFMISASVSGCLFPPGYDLHPNVTKTGPCAAPGSTALRCLPEVRRIVPNAQRTCQLSLGKVLRYCASCAEVRARARHFRGLHGSLPTGHSRAFKVRTVRAVIHLIVHYDTKPGALV